MTAQTQRRAEIENPLDNVEEVLMANNWIWDRTGEDEIIVQIAGKGCSYKLFFIWQEDMNAMQFCCQYDLQIEKSRRPVALKALSSMNEKLWMGHFDIPDRSGAPCFRQTCLFRGISKGSSLEQIEDLVDISLAQCERFYPAFQMLSDKSFAANDDNLHFALMETQGEG